MDKKKFLPYVSVGIIFVIASLLYFNPVLSGKKIKQGDIMQYKGMARESTNYRVDHGKDSYWLRNAFSGMPTYQVGAQFPNDFIAALCQKESDECVEFEGKKLNKNTIQGLKPIIFSFLRYAFIKTIVSTFSGPSCLSLFSSL